MMQYALALVGLASVAYAIPAAVTSAISPPGGELCSGTASQKFTITPVNASTVSTKRTKRAAPDSTLEITLSGGILMDSEGRTGYIASNHQFQFDSPPQAGAIYTAGFSMCANNTLALGQSDIFYACQSGNLYDLYDIKVRSDCSAVYLGTDGSTVGTGSGGSASTSGAGVMSDGQPTATAEASATTGAVGQLTDAQPTATAVESAMTSGAVGQLTDAQPTATAVESAMMTSGAVGQLTDAQPTATAVESAMMTSGAVGQLTDAQPTATAVVSAMSSGLGEMTDGQPTATAVYNATATLAPYTGGAAIPKIGNEMFAIAAGVVAAAML